MRTATVRASKSELLPAPNGTTMRIGRTGKSAAPAATAVVISIARSRHRFIVINSVYWPKWDAAGGANMSIASID